MGFDRKEYMKQYYIDNKEKMNKQTKRWKKDNLEKVKKCNKQWRENNPDKVKEYQKQWEKDNPRNRTEWGKQYYKDNKEKINKRFNQWAKDNPEKHKNGQRESKLKCKYGLSHEDWLAMWEGQDGKCKICEKPFINLSKAFVDHDHKTGKIRGLLCSKCNGGIGFFDDNQKLIMRAINYLSIK